MKNLNLKTGQAALVIVAHPDDETIWSGGIIMKYNQVRWTILSLCRASDPDRAPKFQRVAKHFQAEAIIADLEDEGRLGLVASIKPIKKILKELLVGRSFDYIFTHGANGEYGHERHISVHLAVKELVSTGVLKTNEFWSFNYKKVNKHKLEPKVDSDAILKLSPADYDKKLDVMSQIYGFERTGIDTGYCTNPEAFKKINLLINKNPKS